MTSPKGSLGSLFRCLLLLGKKVAFLTRYVKIILDTL